MVPSKLNRFEFANPNWINSGDALELRITSLYDDRKATSKNVASAYIDLLNHLLLIMFSPMRGEYKQVTNKITKWKVPLEINAILILFEVSHFSFIISNLFSHTKVLLDHTKFNILYLLIR